MLILPLFLKFWVVLLHTDEKNEVRVSGCLSGCQYVRVEQLEEPWVVNHRVSAVSKLTKDFSKFLIQALIHALIQALIHALIQALIHALMQALILALI